MTWFLLVGACGLWGGLDGCLGQEGGGTNVGLGSVFKDALNSESGPDSPKENPFPVDESSSVVVRRPWVYFLGTLGAGTFSVGTLLLLMMMFMSLAHPGWTQEMATIAGGAILGGASLLAVSWIGLLGTGQGGVLPMLGSLAAPLSIIYFRSNMGDPYSIENTIAVLGLGFGLFAAGHRHMLARGAHVAVRVASGVSLFFVAISFYCEAMHAGISVGTMSFLYIIAFGALTATGVILSISFATITLDRR